MAERAPTPSTPTEWSLGGPVELWLRRRLPVPGHKLVDSACRVRLDPDHQVFDVLVGIYSVEPARRDHALEDREVLRALDGDGNLDPLAGTSDTPIAAWRRDAKFFESASAYVKGQSVITQGG
jgi:hypothetical protein